jgi:ASC-1-like (ASCH) protein
MKKSDLKSDLRKHVGRSALGKDPFRTANAIYFMMKQYPVIVGNRRAYNSFLIMIKNYLINDFEWSMVSVHRCFSILKKLTEHMKSY